MKVKVDELVGANTQMDKDSIVIRDVLFPAWNEDDRYPLFFSRAHKESKPETDPSFRDEYKMELSKMITASASNSVYFSPFSYKSESGVTESIIGGGSIAESPALYAFFSAD